MGDYLHRIQAMASIPLEIPILEVTQQSVSQQIAHRAKHLVELGMTHAEVGRRLGVHRKTVARSIDWLRCLSAWV
jgi:hypothetical protein